jgi:hypothetical protein
MAMCLSGHLVVFFRFGMLYQEKSGNPASKKKETFCDFREITDRYVGNAFFTEQLRLENFGWIFFTKKSIRTL